MYQNDNNILSSYIEEGTIKSLWGNAKIKRQLVGNLYISTGKVFAVDPFIVSEYDKPFIKKVPQGSYPVYLSIITTEAGDQRAALATIQFSNEKPQTWELAITDDQDISTLQDDEYFGYGVDAGTGCFMDQDTFHKFYALSEDNEYTDMLIDEMQKTYVDTWSYLNKEIEENCNIIMFSSGIGDGSYPSFFGIDSNGNICCLVTDFMILE